MGRTSVSPPTLFGKNSIICQSIENEQKYAYKCRMEFLTTSEAAEYLRLGERKLYELVTSGAIPCSKVTGKWLFPRHELDLWVLSGLARPAGMIAADPPPIVGGSQDDLLEWTLRESGSGLASLSEGTARGVDRLQRGEVIAAAIHFHSHDISGSADGDANIAAVRATPGLHDAVLVGFARREQGLLLAPGNPKQLHSLADVLGSGAKMAVRQPGAGAQMLLDVLLTRAGAGPKALRRLDPACLTGPDLAAAIRTGKADCGIATRAAAKSAGLDFVPLLSENFDLLMRQRSYFRPQMQALIGFLGQKRLQQRAAELSGYDPTPAGQIRFAA
jgi:putative molybdopterin biosynthesis protein